MTTTSTKMTPGEVDEARYAAFVAQQTKICQRMIDRDPAAFVYTTASEMAEGLCGVYRHQFRTMVPAK